jgi:hypothetical protein
MTFVPNPILGAVVVSGIIAPSDESDTYAVTDAKYGKDGLRNVENEAGLLSIGPDRRRLGMVVGVGVGLNGNPGVYYYLKNNPSSDSTQLNDWAVFQSGGSLSFYNEGSAVQGTFTKVNFVGDQVLAQKDSSDSSRINVFIPSPTFASHYNTDDGTTDGTVYEKSPYIRSSAWISNPTEEGNPFKTGGWAGSTQAATSSAIAIFEPGGPVTGLGGTSTVFVEVFDAGDIKIAEYETPSLTGDTQAGSPHTSSSPNAGITVAISGFSSDASRKKGIITVRVNMNTIFGNILPVAQTGGRYYVRITHKTDPSTDGSIHVFQQDPIFYDANPAPSSPVFTAPVRSLVESNIPSQIITKHLSGVQYYALNSRFTYSINGIDSMNRNSQGRAQSDQTNFRVAAPNYGLPQIDQKTWAPTFGTFSGRTNLWNNNGVSYLNDNWQITEVDHRYRGVAGNATASLFDPWAPGSTSITTNQSILVDTFGVTSTPSVERFDDESRRLNSSYLGPWPSATPLVDGEACVVDGKLIRPDQYYLSSGASQTDLSTFKPDKTSANPNYTGFTSPASYYRKFETGNSDPFPSFRLVITGTFAGGSVLADLQSSALRIFVRRVNSADSNYASGPTSNALIMHTSNRFSSFAFNDGATLPGSYIRTDFFDSATGTIEGTFGGRDALNGILVEIVIASPAIRLEQITFTPIQ